VSGKEKVERRRAEAGLLSTLNLLLSKHGLSQRERG
jgi:hypothetical protein